ncbi:MAG: tetratricopeptide repeat protein [Polyangiaceae bacterium]
MAAPPAPPLSVEVAALDAARAALASGDVPSALRQLDAFDARTGPKRLAGEATLLRIEALLRAGQRGRAADLARRFVEQNPDSPLADRARALTAGPTDSPADRGGSP